LSFQYASISNHPDSVSERVFFDSAGSSSRSSFRSPTASPVLTLSIKTTYFPYHSAFYRLHTYGCNVTSISINTDLSETCRGEWIPLFRSTIYAFSSLGLARLLLLQFTTPSLHFPEGKHSSYLLSGSPSLGPMLSKSNSPPPSLTSSAFSQSQTSRLSPKSAAVLKPIFYRFLLFVCTPELGHVLTQNGHIPNQASPSFAPSVALAQYLLCSLSSIPRTC